MHCFSVWKESHHSITSIQVHRYHECNCILIALGKNTHTCHPMIGGMNFTEVGFDIHLINAALVVLWKLMFAYFLFCPWCWWKISWKLHSSSSPSLSPPFLYCMHLPYSIQVMAVMEKLGPFAMEELDNFPSLLCHDSSAAGFSSPSSSSSLVICAKATLFMDTNLSLTHHLMNWGGPHIILDLWGRYLLLWHSHY